MMGLLQMLEPGSEQRAPFPLSVISRVAAFGGRSVIGFGEFGLSTAYIASARLGQAVLSVIDSSGLSERLSHEHTVEQFSEEADAVALETKLQGMSLNRQQCLYRAVANRLELMNKNGELLTEEGRQQYCSALHELGLLDPHMNALFGALKMAPTLAQLDSDSRRAVIIEI